MNINWKARVKNKLFWLTIIPGILVLIKQILALFGYDIQIEGLSRQLQSIVESIFTILAIAGIVNDPTTKGVSDSDRVLNYNEPK